MLFKYRKILNEGYNFTNTDEVMSAIKTNQVGVKIDPSFKTEQGSIPTKLAFKKFFERCNQLGIKDTTYGIQVLLSKTTRNTLSNAISEDGIYEFLKSYRKPWVKQLPEYNEFINGKYNKELWHKLEKAIQEEQVKHGKVSKGSGQLKDVKTLYDDGTWKLLQPTSFEGEKAAAFYIKDGKEIPTEWCTRVVKDYYERYTAISPLYIIRNMKTGNSYQLAFTSDGVDFLDQNDENGDEITNGDLSKIPDELLKYIKDPRGGRTLYDFKHRKPEDIPHIKGKINNREVAEHLLDKTEAKYGPVIELKNSVCKKEVTNFSHDISKIDELNSFFNWSNSKYLKVPVEYGKKDKATVYFLKNKPNSLLAITTHVDYETKKRDPDGIIMQKNIDELSQEEKQNLEDVSFEDFGVLKHLEREKGKNIDKAEKYNSKLPDMSDEDYDKFVDNINSRIDFKKSNLFTKLIAFPFPSFGAYSKGGMFSKSLVVELHFEPSYELKQKLKLNKRSAYVLFKHLDKENDENAKALKAVPWNKATSAIVITGPGASDFIQLSQKEFEFCKRVAIEIQKEFIKDPDFRDLNMQRKIDQEAQNKKRNKGKTFSRKDLENLVGKDMAHRLSHLDDEKPGAKIPTHVMNSIEHAAYRPDLYEEINYFDY